MPGTLFIVATPIGNLEDLTFRALRTLREVDLIAAEDTRRTAKLLAHYAVATPMVSLHAHNEHREAPRLVERLLAGTSIALVSDAGTPGIADPGEHLVRLARERQIRVVPIPGASAIMAALSISGFPASEFAFMGFVPRSGSERQTWMDRLAAETRTVVFFEAPHRMTRLLSELPDLLGKRQIIVVKELTKIHEKSTKYQNLENDELETKSGEFVLLVSPVILADSDAKSTQANVAKAAEMIGCMTEYGGFDAEDAERLAAAALGINPARIHNLVRKFRIASKRK